MDRFQKMIHHSAARAFFFFFFFFFTFPSLGGNQLRVGPDSRRALTNSSPKKKKTVVMDPGQSRYYSNEDEIYSPRPSSELARAQKPQVADALTNGRQRPHILPICGRLIKHLNRKKKNIYIFFVYTGGPAISRHFFCVVAFFSSSDR